MNIQLSEDEVVAIVAALRLSLVDLENSPTAYSRVEKLAERLQEELR